MNEIYLNKNLNVKIDRPLGRDVNNIQIIYDNLKNNNYKIVLDIEENWYRQHNKLLGNTEFLVQDPDGYLLLFTEDLGEKKFEE